ncbi:hypothetical protein EOD23_03890 [Mesorhizobium sp. USDA-HM6]|nr:hypothetical protein EOD23_03890 [Mesorhizobium sp. USDA-HM6]
MGQIGIPVSVTQLESGALGARTAAPADGGGRWDLVVAGGWQSPSPHDLLSLGNSKLIGVGNPSYWKNEKFDALLSEVDVTADLKKSQELVNQAARLIYADAPYIMLCYPLVLEARRKDCFEGWGTQGIMSMWNYFPFDRLRPV